MSETKSPGIDQISSFIERNGISTLLLVAGVYVAYTNFLKPAGDKYVQMLDAVTESNVSLTNTIAELKDGLRDVGERNTVLANKNSDSLSDIEQHLRELELISRNIEKQLVELRNPRYMPAISEPPIEALE